MIKKRISQKKEERCRVFSCPQCQKDPFARTEGDNTPLYMESNELDSIKKNGVDGYDVVAVVDAKTRQITVLSNVSGRISAEDLQ